MPSTPTNKLTKWQSAATHPFLGAGTEYCGLVDTSTIDFFLPPPTKASIVILEPLGFLQKSVNVVSKTKVADDVKPIFDPPLFSV